MEQAHFYSTSMNPEFCNLHSSKYDTAWFHIGTDIQSGDKESVPVVFCPNALDSPEYELIFPPHIKLRNVTNPVIKLFQQRIKITLTYKQAAQDSAATLEDWIKALKNVLSQKKIKQIDDYYSKHKTQWETPKNEEELYTLLNPNKVFLSKILRGEVANPDEFYYFYHPECHGIDFTLSGLDKKAFEQTLSYSKKGLCKNIQGEYVQIISVVGQSDVNDVNYVFDARLKQTGIPDKLNIIKVGASMLPTIVGADAGTLVGFPVGKSVGPAVGAAVGASVGKLVDIHSRSSVVHYKTLRNIDDYNRIYRISAKRSRSVSAKRSRSNLQRTKKRSLSENDKTRIKRQRSSRRKSSSDLKKISST